MEGRFWLDRWRSGQIGFHQSESDPTLRRWWGRLGVTPAAPVFVPLCGKSLDMRFLEGEGHPVIGVELSEIAVEAYFAEGGEEPAREAGPAGERFVGARTVIHRGDFFDVPGEALAEVRAVYDRAALIALPPAMRVRYVEHLRAILPTTERVVMLLLTIEYDQAAVEGPPFSVGWPEVRDLYAGCEIEQLEEQPAKVLPPKFEDSPVVARAYRIGLG